MGKPVLPVAEGGVAPPAGVLARLAVRPPPPLVAPVALLKRHASAEGPRSRVDSRDWLRLARGAGHTSASCTQTAAAAAAGRELGVAVR